MDHQVFALADLEVMGYATRLSQSMVPTVVTPIFRLRADPDRVVFPPFTLEQGMVHNAALGFASEFDQLVEQEEVTALPGRHPAQEGYTLWVDEYLGAHYWPTPEVEDWLALIARQKLEAAHDALRRGDLDEADQHAGAALSADDRRSEPFLIKAAIRRKRHDESAVRVMARLAEDLIAPPEFEAGLQHWLSQIGGEVEGQDALGVVHPVGDDAAQRVALRGE